jgi:plastocyanin
VHRWVVFVHVAGVFGFLMAHGVSAYVTLRLPRERDPARVSQLLELSASSVGFMWNSIGLLVIAGIVAGFTGHFWGQAWIWVAIAVLVLVMVAMYAMGTSWATRLRTISAAMNEGTEAVSRQQYDEVLASKRPQALAAIGFVGLLLLLWLMIFKPTFGLGGDPCDADAGVAGSVQLCASNDQSFAVATLSADAGEPIQLVFSNEDDGVPHNVAIYADDSASKSLFVGDQITGPDEITYDVPSLDAGSYYYRCDIHPVMDGTLEVS